MEVTRDTCIRLFALAAVVCCGTSSDAHLPRTIKRPILERELPRLKEICRVAVAFGACISLVLTVVVACGTLGRVHPLRFGMRLISGLDLPRPWNSITRSRRLVPISGFHKDGGCTLLRVGIRLISGPDWPRPWNSITRSRRLVLCTRTGGAWCGTLSGMYPLGAPGGLTTGFGRFNI